MHYSIAYYYHTPSTPCRWLMGKWQKFTIPRAWYVFKKMPRSQNKKKATINVIEKQTPHLEQTNTTKKSHKNRSIISENAICETVLSDVYWKVRTFY